MTNENVVLVDEPRPRVRRITMNRPEKRNSLIHPLRGAILETLREHDQDPDVSVTIIRGAGPSFSAGYDLGGGNEGQEMPYYTPGGEGAWPRHVTEGWMSIWDLAKPVIAQVHGYCLAGGSELATGCDLVYMAEDAQMGYPAVRFGVPDMHFHAVVPRDAQGDGDDADRRLDHAASRPSSSAGRTPRIPADELDERVLEVAQRIAMVPIELLQLNKRVVHRQMDVMGLRAGIRAGTELCALGTHTETMREFIGAAREKGLTNALQERDAPFGDYRTTDMSTPTTTTRSSASRSNSRSACSSATTRRSGAAPRRRWPGSNRSTPDMIVLEVACGAAHVSEAAAPHVRQSRRASTSRPNCSRSARPGWPKPG